MKTKSIFILSLVLTIVCSCKNQEESIVAPDKSIINYEKAISEFDSQFSMTFENSKTVNPLSITKVADNNWLGKLERTKMITESNKYLSDEFYKDSKINNNDIESFYNNSIYLNTYNTNSRTTQDAIPSIINSITTFNDEQKNLLNDFVYKVSISSDINDINTLILEYNKNVISSNTLSEEQKVHLLSFSSLSKSFVEFMTNGSIEEIYSSMAKDFGITSGPNNARTLGCTVNWRSVWTGAVIAGAVGAINGAKVGFAGGTVTLPLIGSATGIVGGAVLAGAGGFVAGTATSIAAELLMTCFRNAQSVDTTCKNFFDKFEKGEITIMEIPDVCLDNIKLTRSQIDELNISF